MIIKTINELDASNVSNAGGKGASLGKLTQNNLTVPPGFVIFTQLFKLTLGGKIGQIESLIRNININNSAQIAQAASLIADIITNTTIDPHSKQLIYEHFDSLNTRHVAVRSSAVCEDGREAAWAGQLESYLNTTRETLLENIVNCWISGFTSRALYYRLHKGQHIKGIGVAVVVQTMIQSESAGVGFSTHPVTENQNHIIIEAAHGLGESVVSGKISPDNYTISKGNYTILNKIINTKKHFVTFDQHKGTKWVETPPHLQDTQVLNDKDIIRLAQIIRAIEKIYDTHVDIEWAYKDNEFYILQSRPITTL